MIWHPNLVWYYEFERAIGVDSSQNNYDGEVGKLKMEAGSVNLSGTIDVGVTVSITFQNTYENPPVVIVYNPISGGGQFVVHRVRNITTTGCEVFMEEPDNEDHGAEVCHYFVMERGVHIFPSGVLVEVGSVTTDKTHISGQGTAIVGESVSFSQTMSDPVVLHQVMTRNNDFCSSFCTNLSSSGFELGLELLATGVTSGTEEIGYIVFETPNNKDNRLYDQNGNEVIFEAGYVLQDGAYGYDDPSPYTISFLENYPSAPLAWVSGHTVLGNDGWAPKGDALSSTQHTMWCDEDQIGDLERNHAAEEISWMFFSQAFYYDETAVKIDDFSSKSLQLSENSFILLPHVHDTVGAIGDMTVWFKASIGTPLIESFGVISYDRSEYFSIGSGRTTNTVDDGKLQFSIAGVTTGVVDCVASKTITDGVEHFCAATYEQSTGVVKMYVDGEVVFNSQVLSPGEAIGTGTPRDGTLFVTSESTNGNGERRTGFPPNSYVDSLGYINGTCLDAPDIERLRLGLSPIER